jgi:NAD-dependent dihydropyrimidine dehydrogenase PreA subunit
MTFVITSPCLDTKDQACVDVCPVDCIHFEDGVDAMLYINPTECIDCGACEPACPVDAIFEEGSVPDDESKFIEINSLWYDDPGAARTKLGGGTEPAPEPATTSAETTLAESTTKTEETKSTENNEAIGTTEEQVTIAANAEPEKIAAPKQVEAQSFSSSNQKLPSPASIIVLVPFIFLFIISLVMPGPIIAEVIGLQIGLITIACFMIGNLFLFLFLLFEGKSLAKFSAMRQRKILKWRDAPVLWRRSEEMRRLDLESIITQIAETSFAYPNEEYPSLQTFVNLPEPQLGIEIVGGIGGRIYPDIIVAEQPGNYPKLIGQIESSETVTREQAERVWVTLDNADSTTILFVPTGYGARAKDYIRTAGIKNVQVRTWKRSGDSIRVLPV